MTHALDREWLIADARRTMRRNKARLDKIGDGNNSAVAFALWKAERLVPARITMALDFPATSPEPFHGDWVDEVLGVPLGHVDEWELGVRYPTWEQLAALRELTGKRWLWWFDRVLDPRDTTLVFHRKRGDAPLSRPVQHFNARGTRTDSD